jgi:transposase
MVKSYRGSGSAGYHPALLLGLLVYGYTTGVFSSRKLEDTSRMMREYQVRMCVQ